MISLNNTNLEERRANEMTLYLTALWAIVVAVLLRVRDNRRFKTSTGHLESVKGSNENPIDVMIIGGMQKINLRYRIDQHEYG